jgi:predicted ArsR family transcriptional regulator
MDATKLEQQINLLATLDEPVRRSLYLYVLRKQQEVSRDEAARAVGVSRMLASFHLDRLADAGLLEISFRRLSGRAGPGAGRPSKLYRASPRQLDVSLPPRSYELAAHILAGSIEKKRGRRMPLSLRTTARRTGEQIGAAARSRAGARPSAKKLRDAALLELNARGYEPERIGDEIRFRNCPFHNLATEHRELVCGMNLALIEGALAGLQLAGATAVLDPRPGLCCVALRPAKGGGTVKDQ